MAGYRLINGEYIEYSRLRPQELEEILKLSIDILTHDDVHELSKGVFVMTRNDVIICKGRKLEISIETENLLKNTPLAKLRESPRYKIIKDMLERYKSKNEAAENKAFNPDASK